MKPKQPEMVARSATPESLMPTHLMSPGLANVFSKAMMKTVEEWRSWKLKTGEVMPHPPAPEEHTPELKMELTGLMMTTFLANAIDRVPEEELEKMRQEYLRNSKAMGEMLAAMCGVKDEERNLITVLKFIAFIDIPYGIQRRILELTPTRVSWHDLNCPWKPLGVPEKFCWTSILPGLIGLVSGITGVPVEDIKTDVEVNTKGEYCFVKSLEIPEEAIPEAARKAVP